KELSSIVFVLILVAINLWGQGTQGGLVGTIRDEKGAEIFGARVRVTNVGTGLQRETTTAGNGLYRALALPTGTYEVTAEAQGLKRLLCRLMPISPKPKIPNWAKS